MILGKSETVSPISPTTRARMNIDLDFTPRTINKASELNEKPIDELVSVYHCGISFQDPEKLPKTEMPTVEHTQFVANDQIATTNTFETRKLPKDDIITTFSEQSKGPSINSPKNIPSIETNVIQQDGFKQPIKPKEAKLELFKYENNETEGNHHKYSISEAKFNTPQQNTNTSASINEIPKQKKVHGEQKYSMTLKSKRDIMNEITKHTKFETYQGPLDNTVRASDVEGEPLTQHVSVYHTGRSDDPQEPPIDIGPAHLDYPTSETYQGPLDNTVRPQEPPIDIADTGPAHLDYPTSETYQGPLDNTPQEPPIDIADTA
uniref:Organ specific protein n=1 Tax=Heterorhabditis bacteriophora TaxID=37862 RepID=A0A1I7WSC9_HETBA